MQNKVSNLILNHLVNNEEYARQCIPYIRAEYFDEYPHQILFNEIDNYVKEYNVLPSKESILISLSKNEEMQNTDLAKNVIGLVKKSFEKSDETTSINWLVHETEAWCQERAVYNSIIESIAIIDGKDREKRSKHAIPKILQDALSVSFNDYVGHDYLENFQQRYDFYHQKEDRLQFDIEILNKITQGGLPPKTLSLVLGSSGTGKSLILCHFAASYLSQSKNVLYITLEMSEERIAERIDANLMNIPINELQNIEEPVFKDRIESITEKTTGRLIIKEYPTGSAHVGHFRALINELKMKKNFIPDVILIDYLNICASSRHKSLSGSVNTYSFVKSIAEEIRGLSIEFKIPVWSATQGNRDSFNNTDIDATNVSDSIGTIQTVDFLIAAVTSEELQQRGQMMFKQIKNRFGDPSYYSKFYVGVNRSKMKLYNLDSDDNSAAGPTSSDDSSKSHVDGVLDNGDGHDDDNETAYDFSQFKF